MRNIRNLAPRGRLLSGGSGQSGTPSKIINHPQLRHAAEAWPILSAGGVGSGPLFVGVAVFPQARVGLQKRIGESEKSIDKRVFFMNFRWISMEIIQNSDFPVDFN